MALPYNTATDAFQLWPSRCEGDETLDLLNARKKTITDMPQTA
ncbi:hypothetical protein GCM10010873_34340 [Cypionkella aquatica]|uniref:Uncharacterized protein n=1 Tax=Cypionkella aquatica TaxID=1756042 RepID=A0AA37X3K7_9RHOB|nr:hypothetical protein GCM10010873_34340 [Cypionkella aquatica]